MAVKNKEDNFIFKRSHRRLTLISSAALLPVMVTYVAATFVWLSGAAAAEDILLTIIAMPAWVLAIGWLVLPLVTIYLSRKGYKRGTLHGLRSWNLFTLRLALLLLIGEVLVVLSQLLL